MLARPAHYRSANAQCFVLLAHLLLERLIVSVGLDFCQNFCRSWRCGERSVARIKKQKTTRPSQFKKFNWSEAT
jgi:hypothetical protein